MFYKLQLSFIIYHQPFCLGKMYLGIMHHVYFVKSSGPEIWKDTAGKVDVFVASVGSGGTLTGVGRYLKMKNPSINIVCVEPSESPVISGTPVISLNSSSR